MRHHVRVGLAALLAAAVVACGPTQEEWAELRAQQEQILEKLAKLEEGQKTLAAAAPSRPSRPQEDFDKVHNITVGPSPILGDPEAPITLVEFSDFQCPFCARTAPLLKQVQEKFPGKVRVVYKHFPLNFHPAARPAAIASIAAQEQGKFWEFHDVLFENVRELAPEKMEEYAEKAGLDLEKFKQDYENKRAEYDKRISQEYAEGVRAEVRGTPTLYINGKKVRQRSIEGVSAQVEEELKKAGAS